MRTRRAAVLLAAAVMALGSTCLRRSERADISRERAIEIARSQISFQPDSIDADRTIDSTRAVWRVTLRGRLPGQPPGLFETAVVYIDRQTGEVVSVAKP